MTRPVPHAHASFAPFRILTPWLLFTQVICTCRTLPQVVPATQKGWNVYQNYQKVQNFRLTIYSLPTRRHYGPASLGPCVCSPTLPSQHLFDRGGTCTSMSFKSYFDLLSLSRPCVGFLRWRDHYRKPEFVSRYGNGTHVSAIS